MPTAAASQSLVRRSLLRTLIFLVTGKMLSELEYVLSMSSVNEMNASVRCSPEAAAQAGSDSRV